MFSDTTALERRHKKMRIVLDELLDLGPSDKGFQREQLSTWRPIKPWQRIQGTMC